jgi:hypothetical protein
MYSAAVTELHQKMGTLSKAESDALYRMTEALLEDAAENREKLQSHVS